MKTAIITGSSRGIGKQTAIELAKSGYNLALCCNKNIDSLNELCHSLKKYGIKVICQSCNVSNYEDINKFTSTVLANFKNIDVLINNAGISEIGLLQDLSYERWDEIIKTNLYSVFNMSKNIIPHMIQNKSGKIINISSIWGGVGASCEVAYSTSKGGINAFTKALAKELAPSNIQVNAIAFGLIDTDMNKNLSQEELQEFINEIPIGRISSANEAAQFIKTIIDAPKYLTGQVINFDGGLY